MTAFPPPPWEEPRHRRPSRDVVATAAGSVLLAVSLAALIGVVTWLLTLGDGRPGEESAADRRPAPDFGWDEPEPQAGGRIAVAIFEPTATEDDIERVADEWRQGGLLSSVTVLSEDEFEADVGRDDVAVAAIDASITAPGRDAVEDFVCGYRTRPHLATVAVDGWCTGTATSTGSGIARIVVSADLPDPEPDEPGAPVSVRLRFRPGTGESTIDRIASQWSGPTWFTEVEIDADGPSPSLRAHGFEANGPGICEFAARYRTHPYVASTTTTGPLRCRGLRPNGPLDGS